MKISGFTIIKNAVISDYPVVEAIKSILPVVDEMVVLVGDCKDSTRELIQSIGDDKIKIFDSVWNVNLRKSGEVLADETNKAFKLISPDSDWAFYIQADEVVPEKYLGNIRKACEQYKDDKRVDGLVFDYVHFFGTYDYVGDSRRWYQREIRIIRNDPTISAYRDAQGFRRNDKRLNCKLANATVYHYGWVKSPTQMKQKLKETAKYWIENDEQLEQFIHSEEMFNFNEYDSLQRFQGEHPAVMHDRIKRQGWNVKLDLTKKNFSFKNRLLYRFEKLTGIRLFAFKNYKLI